MKDLDAIMKNDISNKICNLSMDYFRLMTTITLNDSGVQDVSTMTLSYWNIWIPALP
jgi:hypothetical protein